jgi:hypothetical protein
MSIDGFTLAANKNFATLSDHPCYRIGIRALDAAYEAAIQCVPSDGYPVIFGRFLLMCHKHMLSAANLIAACLPEDSVGITRRAVEAAKVASAIRLNDANADAWLSYQERNDRWLKRQSKAKPKAFHVSYENLKGDKYTEALDNFIGMLSDAYVHFTPEYYSTLGWEVRVCDEDPGGQIFLNYFQQNIREIERHLLLLIAIHGTIMNAFDRCFDGYIYRQPIFKRAMDDMWSAAKPLNRDFNRRYGVQPMKGRD